MAWLRFVLGFGRLVLTPFARLETSFSLVIMALTILTGTSIALFQWEWLDRHRPLWVLLFVAMLFGIAAFRLYYQNNRQMNVAVVPLDATVEEFAGTHYKLWILRLTISNKGSRSLRPEFRVVRPVTGIEDLDYGDFPLDLEYTGDQPTLHGRSSATLRVAWARFSDPKESFLFVKGSEGKGHWKEINPTTDAVTADISMRDTATNAERLIRVTLAWDGGQPSIMAVLQPPGRPVLYTPRPPIHTAS